MFEDLYERASDQSISVDFTFNNPLPKIEMQLKTLFLKFNII